MNTHTLDPSANRGPKTGKDGFHTVPNQTSERLNSCIRNVALAGLQSRTRWNASLPFVVFALLCAMMAMPAYSRTIYVKPSGNDAGSGTSANPYRTVARAHGVAVAGDVILLGSGHYEEYLTLTKRVSIESWNGAASVGSVRFVNRAPVISGITNTTFQYPEGHWPGAAYVELPGVVTDDGLPDPRLPVQVEWTVVQGAVILATSLGAKGKLATFQTPGPHVLQITASDGLATTTNHWNVVWIPYNIPPPLSSFRVRVQVDGPAVAGSVISITGEVFVDGRRTYPPEVKGVWGQWSGPGEVVFTPNPENMSATANFSKAGTYTSRFTGFETAGYKRSLSDPVTVVVVENPDVPFPPPCSVTAFAGSNFELTWPRGRTAPLCTNLNGAVKLNNQLNPSTGVTVNWTFPPEVTLDNRRIRNPRACFPGPGDYELTLWVTGCDPAVIASNSVIVRVTPERDCPAVAVDPGPNQTVYLDDYVPGGRGLVSPSVCTLLSGTVNPNSGMTVRWTQQTGPTKAKFENTTSAATSVCFSNVGTYQLRLTATTGTCSNWSDMFVNVRYAPRHYMKAEFGDTAGLCGSIVWFKNTHPTCSIEATFLVRTCGLGPGGTITTTRTYTVQPGGKTDPWVGFANDYIEMTGATFLCTEAATSLGATLQLPAANSQRQFIPATAPGINKESILLASADTGGESAEQVEMLFSGEAGHTYSIEASDDLQTWTPIDVLTASDLPVWVLDPDTGMHQRRFYRAMPR